MANEIADNSGTIMQSVTRMLNNTVNEGADYDTLIHVLSLVCLVSILNRSQTPAAQAPAAAAPAGNPLTKLLGDLTKGEGGGTETLMSLLPLLNNPQIKSKLNPATLSAVFGLLNNLGDKGDKSDKQEAKAEKAEEKAEARRPAPPAAALTSSENLPPQLDDPEAPEGERRNIGRYLNWKSNF
jgi:hypothetical protein